MASPLVPFEGDKGRASIARLEGDALEVFASAPSAPGSRPALTLPASGAVRMKVHRCRAVSAGVPRETPAPELTFFLEGRLIDASRAVRAEIEAMLVEGSG